MTHKGKFEFILRIIVYLIDGYKESYALFILNMNNAPFPRFLPSGGRNDLKMSFGGQKRIGLAFC